MSLVKNSQEYLDDPELEKKLMNIRNSIGEVKIVSFNWVNINL